MTKKQTKKKITKLTWDVGEAACSYGYSDKAVDAMDENLLDLLTEHGARVVTGFADQLIKDMSWFEKNQEHLTVEHVKETIRKAAEEFIS